MRHHFTPTKWLQLEGQAETRAGEHVEQLEPPYTAGGNGQWRPRCGKQPGRS